MGGSDMQFCLRWNNFGTTMTAALHTLHEGGDFVDVTLAADGMQLKAHKLILSACSPYFRDILKVSGEAGQGKGCSSLCFILCFFY